jgi:hypothetical protein
MNERLQAEFSPSWHRNSDGATQILGVVVGLAVKR